METEINKLDYMEDARGALIPKGCVKEIDLLRDSLVLEIVNKTIELNRILNNFKTKTMSDLAAFLELSAEKYDVHFGGAKGNVQLLSYDGKYKIMRSINDYIVFDERLQIAKQLIDECVKRWSGDSSSEIKALINHAFQVDKAGKISTERILGLRRLDIKDAGWLKAMEAISDSIQVTGSKEYLRIYKRDDNGKYQQINLDIAAI
jgi:hypothetical protein